MRIALASDHGGLRLKHAVIAHLRAQGHEAEDLGPFDDASVDYPDYAKIVAHKVVSGEFPKGILVCGTGQGMAITANHISGIRAAIVSDTFSARMAAEHNDANILCLGQRVVGEGLAMECVDAWLNTPFAGGRHARRVEKIETPHGL